MSDIQDPTPTEGADGAPSSRPGEYIADISFEEMNLSEPLRRAIAEAGYTNPTPVQSKAFGPVMEGRDLIVRSKTGTGKTAAFGLPLLEKISAEDKGVRALILCPTRELAMQVAEELTRLGKYKGVKVAAIYGGASMKQQEDALEEGTQIIVGTPGRVFDHIGRGNLKLDGCRFAVLDEADEMLNQGFYEEVTRILDRCPKDRQVLLFSATVPNDIQRLIARYTTNAETLLLSGDVFTVEHIHHIRYNISEAFPKPRNLIYVLESEEPQNAIIFCNTRDDTALVTAVLNRNGFDAELLNGDLPQKERERVMAKMKRGEVAFMVATDIAARGIDISGLEYVINYSLPEDAAVYLHRVGRTGRIGNKGTAINLYSGRELATYTTLEKKYGIKFEQRTMPAPEEAMRMWSERHIREIREAAAGAVSEGFFPLASQLKTRPDADDLVAFLLKYFFSHMRMEKAKAAAEAEGRPPPEAGFSRSEGRKERERGGERGGRGERERPPRREDRERSSSSEAPRAPRAELGERERRPRRDEPRRSSSGPSALDAGPGEAKLWVNLGTADGLGPGSIATALESAGAPVDKVLRAELRPTFAYVFVAEADAAAFEALSGKSHGTKTLKVEKSRPRGERDPARPPRSPEAEPGQAKLWVNLGTDDGLDEASFVKALEAAGAPAGQVQKSLLRPAYGYAYVAEADAGAFEALSGKLHGTKPLKLERHRPRPPREERGSRERRSEPPAEQPGQVRLWVGLGRQDGLDETMLTQALETAGAPAGKVQRLELRPTYAYVFVAEEDASAFEALHGKTHGERTLKIERAKRR
jgi:ATP-dependent RNA helicase DeaD